VSAILAFDRLGPPSTRFRHDDAAAAVEGIGAGGELLG